MNIDSVFFIISCVGCVAFSFFGSMVAIRHNMDIFGIWFSAVITTFGGGVIRDICIGQIPPLVFIDKEFVYYMAISTAVSFICMLLFCFRKPRREMILHSNGIILNTVDAIGLATFAIAGMHASFDKFSSYPLFLVFIGTVTGVGGGAIRDILMGEIPSIFKKHFYAIPTIIGSALYAVLYLTSPLPHIASVFISIGTIVVLRVLATVFKWNLPVLGKKEDDSDKLIDTTKTHL